MLHMHCSNIYFTGQAWDFTFAEVAGVMDCFNSHSMDLDAGIVLTLFRIYASAKSARATAFYLHHLELECSRRGFEFVWGESIVFLIVDSHYGQANGLLQHLITKFGLEDGAKMYTTLLAGCQTHLGKAVSDKITQCAATWNSEDLMDVGIEKHAAGGAPRLKALRVSVLQAEQPKWTWRHG
jgi:hypothetical protein